MNRALAHPLGVVVAFLCLGNLPVLGRYPDGGQVQTSTGSTRLNSPFFGDWLKAGGTVPEASETRELSGILQGGAVLLDQHLERFLVSHPGSPWRATLRTHLGMLHRRRGEVGLALQNLREAWAVARAFKDANGLEVGDLAAAQYADLLARLGKGPELARLLAQVKDRPFLGPPSDLIQDARRTLRVMEQDPAAILRCGLQALERLAEHQKLPSPAYATLLSRRATPRGTNLAQLLGWGREAGLSLQALRLDPQKPIPLPALVHWREGHFGSLLEQRGDLYLAKDYLNGESLWVDRSTLNRELSPLALTLGPASIPTPQVSELESVWGAGPVDGPPEPWDGDPEQPEKCNNKGMPQYGMVSTTATLRLRDTPLWFSPPVGEPFELRLVYNARNVSQPSRGGALFGSKWESNLNSFIKLDYSNVQCSTTPIPLSIYESGSEKKYGYIHANRVCLKWELPNSSSPSPMDALRLPNAIPVWTCGGVVLVPAMIKQEILRNTPPDQIQLLSDPGITEKLTVFRDLNFVLGENSLNEVVARVERQLHDATLLEYVNLTGFERADLYLTKRIEPTGHTTTYSYDSNQRLVSITGPTGLVVTLEYGLSQNPYDRAYYCVTKVTDPFGRFASFNYTGSLYNGSLLTSITDMGGLTSTFTYGPTPASPNNAFDFLNAMTTPYGTTSFATGDNGPDRWTEVTDPYGAKERMEFRNYTVGISYRESQAPPGFDNDYLQYRNSLFWDKRAMLQAPGDVTKAHINHWLHGPSRRTSHYLESEKKPLEARTWYHYGQTGVTFAEGPSRQPLRISRVLPDGAEVKTTFTYNDQGKVTKTIDPQGRETTQVYSADGLDLLEVRNTTAGANDLLATYTYNPQRRPLTVTDAAGATTTMTYNAAGQITTVTNAKQETTTFVYNGSGFLTSILAPGGAVSTSFTYDALGRVETVTTADGQMTSFEYDAFDRKTKTIYPDGTYEQTMYDRLDAVRMRDRAGRWTLMSYNALRQLDEVRDPEGRVTRLGWCGCGTLESLTDPNGRVTQWIRDHQGRVIAKVLDDMTQTQYFYDALGRLQQRVDAKGQFTLYNYFLDGNLKGVSYPGGTKPTPPVTYTYDPAYNRLATMVDGLGTTTFTYHPLGGTGAGRLATTTSTLPASTISYGYDVLGRVETRSIDGSVESRTYDALGRLDTVTNPLGVFGYAYEGSTGRLREVTYPNGQKAQFTYYDGQGLFRLKEIKNLRGNGTNISTFGYDYDASGQIKTWTQQADVQTPKAFSFQYDQVGQLLKATVNEGTPQGALIKTYAYGYDQGGNRTSEQIDDLVTTADHNGVNQLVSTRQSSASAPLVQTEGRKAKSNTLAPSPRTVPPAKPAAKPKAATATRAAR